VSSSRADADDPCGSLFVRRWGRWWGAANRPSYEGMLSESELASLGAFSRPLDGEGSE